MKFFSKLKKDNPVIRKSIFDYPEMINQNNWQDVFSACLGKMLVIQNIVSKEVVKGRDWNVDFSKQIIAFGKDEYPIQFIGSESSSSNTWLWGWENINGFSEEIIQLANTTKAYGEQWNLDYLMTPELELNDEVNGHNLAIVTCGLSKEEICYYRGPHANGAILVSFSNLPKNTITSIDTQEFIDMTLNCIQQYNVNHKIFVESLLLWNGTDYEYQDQELIAHFKNDLIILFEEANGGVRIKNIKTRG